VRAWAGLNIPPEATPEQVKAKQSPPSLRQKLEKVEKQTGIRDPRLDSVKIPEGFRYLWDLFRTVRGGASEGMSGARITWRDLEAYQDVTGISLDAFEVEAIMAMDEELRDYLAERRDGS